MPVGNAYLLGDANLDGTVDGVDFLIWNQYKFTSTTAWTRGDFTVDATIDGGDFLVWNIAKFMTSDLNEDESVAREAAIDFVSELFAERGAV